MKELFQGRPFGFAPRPLLAFLAVGLGSGVTLLDLLAYFGWGARDTNGYVVGAYWLAIITAIVAAFAALAALAEFVDVLDDERGLARLDLAAAIIGFFVYAGTAALRSTEVGAAAASPAPFLGAIAGLLILLVDAVVAANLYAAREWEELEEEPTRERHPRRRAAGR